MFAPVQRTAPRPRRPKPASWFARLRDTTLLRVLSGTLGIDWTEQERRFAQEELDRRARRKSGRPLSRESHRRRPPGDGTAGVREPRRPKPSGDAGRAEPPEEPAT